MSEDNVQLVAHEDLIDFFCQIVHGTEEQRIWLKTEFEKFWNISLPKDKIGHLLKVEHRNVL